MNIHYSKDKDKALIVEVSKFRYPTVKPKKSLIKQVNYWTYAEEAYKALCLVDDRFTHLSPTFRDDVVLKALCAEFSSKNLNNKTKSEVFYPGYLDMLKGINYFSLILKIGANNSAEHSVMIEVDFFKKAYNKTLDINSLSPEDREAFAYFQSLKKSA